MSQAYLTDPGMTTTERRSDRFDVPLYSVSDAARHINVPRSTFDTGVRGYSRWPKGKTSVTGAPVVTLLPSQDRGRSGPSSVADTRSEPRSAGGEP